MRNIIVFLLCICFLFLGGCSASFTGGEPTPREKAKLVLECFDNDDAETLKTLFCKETLSSVDNLDEQIDEAFEFYKGKSVDVGPISVAGQESVRYGIVVKESASPYVKINKTSEDKRYVIVITMLVTDADNPDAIGISQIDIHECDVVGDTVDIRFVTFGVKGLLQASKNIRNALLFNILSYMSNELLTKGNTVASIDEFYLFLSNLTAVEYIRNFMKRVRKKESSVILASQNLEDFCIENIRELTKPLFSIPTHQFLFNAGTIDSKFYTDALQLEDSEFNLIRHPKRGVCLYKCGNERYCLCVHAPEHKSVLFGNAGGR